jgi:hypothetical protein
VPSRAGADRIERRLLGFQHQMRQHVSRRTPETGDERETEGMNMVLNVRKTASGTILAAALLAALVLASSSFAAPHVPRVSTGGVKHVRGNSGQLDAVVDPNGVETSYFFEYGPTVAYGTVTKAVPLGRGLKGIKVGQPVTGILPGYHYRVVASYTGPKGPALVQGKDKSFIGGKSTKLRFAIARGKENEITVGYGGSAELEGALTGLGNTNHGLILQATPYPYTTSFTNLLGPLLSNLSGHFLFKVAKLTQNTEFRILTVDTRPLYSPIMTVHVTPKIVLRVRPAGGAGRYRLYGTVAPAKLRGTLTIQELKPQKANSKHEGPKAHTIASAQIKKGTGSAAQFSTVLTLSGTTHYRAYIKLGKGSLVSGHSNNVLVHAPKLAATKHARRTHAKRTHAKKKK